jgi:hypothetical protein
LKEGRRLSQQFKGQREEKEEKEKTCGKTPKHP